MKYLWNLVFHFFSSNSRHGTHSPFMYKLADEVIYAKTEQNQTDKKQQVLLEDIARYFHVRYVASNLDSGIGKAYLVKDPLISLEQLAVLQKMFKYLVILDIYKDKERRQLWLSICRDPNFIVCVDLFYYGLVFYRKEQPKEIFKMRFPYCR